MNRMMVEIYGHKGHSGDVSDGNEEQVIGNWRKGNSFYKVAKNMAELFSSV